VNPKTTEALVIAAVCTLATCVILLTITEAVDRDRNSQLKRWQREAVFLGYGVGEGDKFQWTGRRPENSGWFDE
jgi:hypothetical protein